MKFGESIKAKYPVLAKYMRESNLSAARIMYFATKVNSTGCWIKTCKVEVVDINKKKREPKSKCSSTPPAKKHKPTKKPTTASKQKEKATRPSHADGDVETETEEAEDESDEEEDEEDEAEEEEEDVATKIAGLFASSILVSFGARIKDTHEILVDINPLKVSHRVFAGPTCPRSRSLTGLTGSHRVCTCAQCGMSDIYKVVRMLEDAQNALMMYGQRMKQEDIQRIQRGIDRHSDMVHGQMAVLLASH
jgi:biotin carboxyl carrier protein